MEKHYFIFLLILHIFRGFYCESSRDTMNSRRCEWQKWTMEERMKEEEKGEIVALIDSFN